MTEIDTSRPNPAFDAWLAVNVMGWHKVCISTASRVGYASAWHWLDANDHDHGTISSWRPTISIAAAWQLIERITDPAWATRQKRADGIAVNTLFVHLFDQAQLWALTAEEAALAICQAAHEACSGEMKR